MEETYARYVWSERKGYNFYWIDCFPLFIRIILLNWSNHVCQGQLGIPSFFSFFFNLFRNWNIIKLTSEWQKSLYWKINCLKNISSHFFLSQRQLKIPNRNFRSKSRTLCLNSPEFWPRNKIENDVNGARLKIMPRSTCQTVSHLLG